MNSAFAFAVSSLKITSIVLNSAAPASSGELLSGNLTSCKMSVKHLYSRLKYATENPAPSRRRKPTDKDD